MKKFLAMLLVATAATGFAAGAQEPAKAPAAKAAAKPAGKAAVKPAAKVDDEAEIRALLDAFTKAFDAGDAEAAAATYSETAIVVDEAGERVEGRAAIRDRYAETFADNPGQTIAIRVDALRLLGPETAIEVGEATLVPPEGGGAPEVSRFTAVYVKHDGRWLQSAVRDETADVLSPGERLKELEWLVGDWVNESQDAVVHTQCDWAPGGHFLDREFSVKVAGEAVLSGTQRIGWDPLTKRFKTWIFDSEGGHGEGFWTRDGDRWLIKVEGVGSDGLPTSATNIVTRLGKDRMGWQSVDRTVGGAAVPEIVEFVVVRKPPEAGK